MATSTDHRSNHHVYHDMFETNTIAIELAVLLLVAIATKSASRQLTNRVHSSQTLQELKYFALSSQLIIIQFPIQPGNFHPSTLITL